ncbi:MAG: TetR/AcrR family transcriptional regulator [Nannocystaceae bacterium]
MSIPTIRVQEQATAHGQQTRQRLLDASEEVFGEEGFERASIVAIARGADVALGTFYVYFPNKQAIFSELVIALGHALRRRLSQATRGLTTRIEIEEAGCIAFLEFVQDHKNFYKIVRQAEFVDEDLYRNYYRKLASSYTEGLARAMDAGELARIDPELVAYMLMGIFDFIGMRWVLWEGKLPPANLLEDVFRFIRNGLLAPAASR